MSDQKHETTRQLKDERWSLLEQVNALTEKPFIVLAFVWLALLIIDFTRGLGPLLQNASYVIWALFALDFLIEFTIAPHKLKYLRRNWLTAISLLLPAVRMLRVFRALRVLRAARAARSVSLLRVVTSLNRGMRAVGNTLGRRGIGYVISLTVIVTFAGAAGMYAFESPAALCEASYPEAELMAQRAQCQAQAVDQDRGLGNYGEAVWWTAMVMTTMGSDYFPLTAEGRILGWLLAVYAFAIFGYITATIASYFVGRDTAAQQAPAVVEPGENRDTGSLQREIAALREQMTTLTTQLQLALPPSVAPEGEKIAPRT